MAPQRTPYNLRLPAGRAWPLSSGFVRPLLTFFRAARNPFVLQHLEHSACNYACQCGIAAACSMYYFLGCLACPIIGSAGSTSIWAFYLANMLADVGMLTRYPLPGVVASAFLAQPMLPFLGSMGRGQGQDPHDVKMEHVTSQVALLLGPWFGIWISSFEGSICVFLVISVFAVPFLFVELPTKEIEFAPTGRSLLSDYFMEPMVKPTVLFILFWRFLLAFGFYAFNMLLASSLSSATPRFLAILGSVCFFGELVGAKASQVSIEVELGASSGSGCFAELRKTAVARTALAVVALSRLSAFLASADCAGARSACFSSFSGILLLVSLFASILAAHLLSDLQSHATAHFQLQIDGGHDIHKLEQAVDTLAGVTGPLYVRSVAAYHGLGTAMAGLCFFYVALHVFIQMGLGRINFVCGKMASKKSTES